MPAKTGVDRGRHLYDVSRGKTPAKTNEQLAATNVGRGQLLRRARAGDAEARDALNAERARLSDGARAALDAGGGGDDAA